VFDREGYSPVFFKEMWDKRIACYTYRKCVRLESEIEQAKVQKYVQKKSELAEFIETLQKEIELLKTQRGKIDSA